MAGKKKRIDEIVAASLEEAKKKARALVEAKKKDADDDNDDEETEEEKEDGPGADEEDEKVDVKKMKKKSKMKEDVDIEEETDTASSLHPAARAIADPKALSDSKVGMMSGVMGAMAGMDKAGMLDFFNQVIGQYGPGKTYGVGDNSAHNQGSLDMKPSNAVATSAPKTAYPMPKLKEDVEAMFEGQDLTEEFKEKATTLFEAAVSARVILEMTVLEEQYADSIVEEITVFKEEVTDKLDAYLDYVVENWMEENKVAIESTLKNELTSEFISGLRNLCVEHHIELPEEKVDIVETLAEKVDTLEQLLDETITENANMKDIISEVAKKEIFEELVTDLTLTQQEKFLALSEGIEFDVNDIDTYTKKLGIIKETYFKISEKKNVSSNINEEIYEGSGEEIVTNTAIGRYATALARTVKK